MNHNTKNVLKVAIDEPKWFFVLNVIILISNIIIAIVFSVMNYNLLFQQTAQKTELRIYTNGAITKSLITLKNLSNSSSSYYDTFLSYVNDPNSIEYQMYKKNENGYERIKEKYTLENVSKLFMHYKDIHQFQDKYIYLINNGDTDIVINDIWLSYFVFIDNSGKKDIDDLIKLNDFVIGGNVLTIDMPNEFILKKDETRKINYKIDSNSIFQGAIYDCINLKDQISTMANIVISVDIGVSMITTKGPKWTNENDYVINKMIFPINDIYKMFSITSSHFFYALHDSDLRDGSLNIEK